jgi:hypothetical protein
MRARHRFRPIALALLIVAFWNPSAKAASADSSTVLQAPVSETGLTIVTGRRRAVVLSDGERVESIRLRTGERLEAVAEIDRGFVTAGVREEESESRIFLLDGRSSGVRRFPSPPAEGVLQLRPVLLTHDEALVGAAWLEGPSPGSLRVKAAEWDGVEWGPAVTVSRASRGSQTGLAGTVLDSGAWLLVWSQFDGRDDEIMFSWREGANWSSALRVTPNNVEPDIAPALGTTKRGALLAWSRFDGSDYRLWTAEFDRGSWSRIRQVGGPGSLFPEILQRDGTIYTIVRRAAPRGWSVRKRSLAGSAETVAFVPVPDSRRPMLLRDESNSITLGWPQSGRVAEGRLERVP